MWTERTQRVEDTYVYAPSLRALPAGMPLVMATLPVSNWNGELLHSLREIEPIAGPICYAAVMMIDPFTLWEDVADALAEKGFAGVTNFPPATLVETNPHASSDSHSNEEEVQRIRWFGDAGMKLAVTAVTPEGVVMADTMFPDALEAVLYAPVSSLSQPVVSVTPLSSSNQFASRAPVWALPARSLLTLTPRSDAS